MRLLPATFHIAHPWALVLVVLLSRPGWSSPADAAGYTNYETFRVELESLADSPLASLESLGQTRAGRDVYVLNIGSGSPDHKPAILVVGNVDARHLFQSELAVGLARKLIDRCGTDKRVKELLDRFTFYIIPRPAPDAAEAFFESPRVERTANTRPVDDDNDGDIDEDGPDDLNGDGRITMMRIEDSAGPYMPHLEDPRVLIKADRKRGERGCYRLYREGKDNDGDGRINEDGPGGVCFNRNFTFGYDYFGVEAGPYQVSEPETRAVVDFAFSHPNIAAVVTLTPEDNLMRPWKPKAQEVESSGKTQGEKAVEKTPDTKKRPRGIQTAILAEDAAYHAHLAEQYQVVHGGKCSAESPKGAGSFSEWAYFHYGRWSLATRGWSIPEIGTQPESTKEGKSENDAHARRGADELHALRWFARRKIDGFVDWKPFAHPDFPDRKVEIGGFVPFARWNPPAEDLPVLIDRHFEFTCSLAERLPKLTIRPVKLEPLGSDVYRVTVTVVNAGYLPTVSAMGTRSGEPHPLQIAWTLPEQVTLLSGHRRGRLPPIAGNGATVETQILMRSSAVTRAAVSVRVWSPSVGRAVEQFTLGPARPATSKNL